MSDLVYPVLPGLTYEVGKTPEFRTLIQSAVTGKETRIGLRLFPLYIFNLEYEFLRSDANAELQSLFGFFLSRRGSFDSFLFDDPDDRSVTDQNIGTGNGVTTDFALQRTYGTFTEPVMNPHTITNVKVAGSSASYTNLGAGVVRISPAPASSAAVTWTGTYYFRCRFQEDVAEFNKFMDKFWSTRQISFLGCLGLKIQ